VTFHSHGKPKNNGICMRKFWNWPWDSYVHRGNFTS